MDVAPWGIGAFVTGLVGTVIYGLRLLLVGKLVPGRLHDEVRKDRDAYRAAADTALAATREMSGNVARLTSAVEQLAATTREILALVSQHSDGRAA